MKLVLVVEDDEKIRRNVVVQLRDEGFGATAVASAEEALLSGITPDLLLVDVRLPGMSGVDLVRKLVKDDQLPPTIIISGEASITETVEGLRLGVFDFIEKPFTRERLLHSVHTAIRHADLQREIAVLRGSSAQNAIRGRSTRRAAPSAARSSVPRRGTRSAARRRPSSVCAATSIASRAPNRAS